MSAYDAVIVGGGPAGTAFAFVAASRGKRVIVFEKNAVPSPKVCGGVLGPRVWRSLRLLELEEEVRRIPAQPLRFIEVEHAEGEHVRIPFRCSHSDLCVVNRSALDAVLWSAAGRVGAIMRDGTSVRRISRDENARHRVPQWVVETRHSGTPSGTNGSHGTHHAGALIGADGRNSFVAAQQGLSATIGGGSHCFQYQLVNHDFSPEGVHFFIFPGGYCGLSVDGEGVAHLDVISLRGREGEGLLRDRLFSQRSLFVEKLERARFHPGRPMARSPIGSGRRNFPLEPSLCLLGDAQAWVEPFTGEGIAMAIESARCAAESFCVTGAFSRRIPLSSRTNDWVAFALQSSWKARAIIRLLDRVPVLARWMVQNVLTPRSWDGGCKTN